MLALLFWTDNNQYCPTLHKRKGTTGHVTCYAVTLSSVTAAI